MITEFKTYEQFNSGIDPYGVLDIIQKLGDRRRNSLRNTIKNFEFEFDNPTEMINICKILLASNFNVYNSSLISNGIVDYKDAKYFSKMSAYAYITSKGILRSRSFVINLKDLIEIIKKVSTLEFIKNPELDPYDEEDWGEIDKF